MPGLTRAQHGLYRKLWTSVLAQTTEADRLAFHAELGLPESRADWTNAHFDEFKRACLAISQPGNLDAQLQGQRGEATRRLHVIHQLLAQLDLPLSYAEETTRQMGYRPPLELLSDPALKKLIIALRKHLKRGTASRSEISDLQSAIEQPDPDWSLP